MAASIQNKGLVSPNNNNNNQLPNQQYELFSPKRATTAAISNILNSKLKLYFIYYLQLLFLHIYVIFNLLFDNAVCVKKTQIFVSDPGENYVIRFISGLY